MARLLGEADGTLIQRCHAHSWHDVLRIKQEEDFQRKRSAHFHDWLTGSQVVRQPGQSWFETGRLWKEHAYEAQLSAVWEEGCEEAWFLISERPAGRKIVKQDRWRKRVESPFQGMRRRGWQRESSPGRQRDRLERLFLVLLF